jgi:hypothetical protein
VLAEELVVIDAQSALWAAARPLLDVALRLELNGENYVWHGWNKRQIESLLASLPSHCSLVVGVWEVQAREGTAIEQETLSMGIVCEVVDGTVTSICTFDALVEAGLKATNELEPGFEDAVAIMRATRSMVAPVAWALFTDRGTWNEWVLACDEDQSESVIDKGELLATFARQGRCVLMGSQTTHFNH